jgi:hypothetical protein
LTGFGFENVDGSFTNEDGSVDVQAGSHPYEFLLNLNFNTEGDAAVGGQVRNLEIGLPPGFIGDPGAVAAQCHRQQLDLSGSCPVASQVGVAETGLGGSTLVKLAVYDMVPPPGEPAQLGFSLLGITGFTDFGVSPKDFALTAHIDNIPERFLIYSHIKIWGVPGDPGHDLEREGSGGKGCSKGVFCELSGSTPKPFLTLPTGCEGPLTFSLEADTWEAPKEYAQASFLTHNDQGAPAGFTGCEHLGFAPSITAEPDTTHADTPAGLNVDVRMPQEGLTVEGQLAESTIKTMTVKLPQGIVINPGQAAGLAACQDLQANLESEGPPQCPSASTVGKVRVNSPLLENAQEKELAGEVYVLQSEPPRLRLLIAASGDGLNIKVVARVNLNPQTGQLTAYLGENPANQGEANEINQTLAEDPQLKGHLGFPPLPISDAKLSFSGGAQAALVTPTTCGEDHTQADFTPSATPYLSDTARQTSFLVSTGTLGGPCPTPPLPFTPTLHAGSTTDQAGGYTSFSTLLQTTDDQQRTGQLQFTTPPGLLAMIASVPLCPEPQANTGDCPPSSQIGHTIVASGPGPYPLVVPEPGQPPAAIYLTGPYQGAPFGLSIVVPVIAGPFNLGTQVVRATININPTTAQATITTNPPGEHSIPPILDGVPTDLRTINAVIDRPRFMFNPTHCHPLSFTGTATSTEHTTAPLESRFQVGSCQALKFKPDFKVTTSGKTTRKNGASLNVTLTYPTSTPATNQATTQANIHTVKVELPKQLPARLTTLQKACLAATFQTNPAACPPASAVGYATVHTPILNVPLTGPAYFVSHGGEAFPALIIVLQGQNITVDLEGTTYISKKGITSSTFKNTPDVPFTQFQLTLPQGPNSALAANGNLCKTKHLNMPTQFTAQNNLEIHQNTTITTTSCTTHPKPKHHTASKPSRKR